MTVNLDLLFSGTLAIQDFLHARKNKQPVDETTLQHLEDILLKLDLDADIKTIQKQFTDAIQEGKKTGRKKSEAAAKRHMKIIGRLTAGETNKKIARDMGITAAQVSQAKKSDKTKRSDYKEQGVDYRLTADGMRIEAHRKDVEFELKLDRIVGYLEKRSHTEAGKKFEYLGMKHRIIVPDTDALIDIKKAKNQYEKMWRIMRHCLEIEGEKIVEPQMPEEIPCFVFELLAQHMMSSLLEK